MQRRKLDCVSMKSEIQRKLQERWAGLTALQRMNAIHRDLDASASPIGELWRRLRNRHFDAAPARRARVAEPRPKYGRQAARPRA